MTLSENERRWGQGVIDLQARNLASLKAERIVDAVRALPIGAEVLDYGCGEGKLLNTISKLRPDLKLHGIDIQSPLQREVPFEFSLIENDSCSFFDRKFDMVLSFDVLEHVLDPEKTLKNMRGMLKDNGTLLLFVPMEGEALSPFGFYRFLLGQNLYVITKSHIQNFQKRDFFPLLKKQFEIEKVSYSYHALGTFLDATFFAMARIKSISKWFWSSNSVYRPENKRKGLGNLVLEFANWLCYYESTFFKDSPFMAMGVHFQCRPISPGRTNGPGSIA